MLKSLRRYPMSLKIRLLVSMTLVLALMFGEGRPAETSPDVVGINGTLGSVPGYPAGTKLNYRVGAVKTGDSMGKTAHFWLKLKNPNAFAIDVVVCSMLTLHNKPHKTVPRTIVVKNAANEWECQTSGTSS